VASPDHRSPLQRRLRDLPVCPLIVRCHSRFPFLRLVLVFILNRAQFVLEIDGPAFGSRVLHMELSKSEIL